MDNLGLVKISASDRLPIIVEKIDNNFGQILAFLTYRSTIKPDIPSTEVIRGRPGRPGSPGPKGDRGSIIHYVNQPLSDISSVATSHIVGDFVIDSLGKYFEVVPGPSYLLRLDIPSTQISEILKSQYQYLLLSSNPITERILYPGTLNASEANIVAAKREIGPDEDISMFYRYLVGLDSYTGSGGGSIIISNIIDDSNPNGEYNQIIYRYRPSKTSLLTPNEAKVRYYDDGDVTSHKTIIRNVYVELVSDDITDFYGWSIFGDLRIQDRSNGSDILSIRKSLLGQAVEISSPIRLRISAVGGLEMVRSDFFGTSRYQITPITLGSSGNITTAANVLPYLFNINFAGNTLNSIQNLPDGRVVYFYCLSDGYVSSNITGHQTMLFKEGDIFSVTRVGSAFRLYHRISSSFLSSLPNINKNTRTGIYGFDNSPKSGLPILSEKYQDENGQGSYMEIINDGSGARYQKIQVSKRTYLSDIFQRRAGSGWSHIKVIPIDEYRATGSSLVDWIQILSIDLKGPNEDIFEGYLHIDLEISCYSASGIRKANMRYSAVSNGSDVNEHLYYIDGSRWPSGDCRLGKSSGYSFSDASISTIIVPLLESGALYNIRVIDVFGNYIPDFQITSEIFVPNFSAFSLPELLDNDTSLVIGKFGLTMNDVLPNGKVYTSVGSDNKPVPGDDRDFTFININGGTNNSSKRIGWYPSNGMWSQGEFDGSKTPWEQIKTSKHRYFHESSMGNTPLDIIVTESQPYEVSVNDFSPTMVQFMLNTNDITVEINIDLYMAGNIGMEKEFVFLNNGINSRIDPIFYNWDDDATDSLLKYGISPSLNNRYIKVKCTSSGWICMIHRLFSGSITLPNGSNA